MRSPKNSTMSVRSNSPWTRTSRPASSCQCTASVINRSISSSYCCWSISPRRSDTRSRRTSAVCGKLPVVVVGNGGRSRSAWAAAPFLSRGPGLHLADRGKLGNRWSRGRRVPALLKRSRPSCQGGGLLAGELEAIRQVLTLGCDGEEHERRRWSHEHIGVLGQAGQRIGDRFEWVGPDTPAVHDSYEQTVTPLPRLLGQPLGLRLYDGAGIGERSCGGSVGRPERDRYQGTDPPRQLTVCGFEDGSVVVLEHHAQPWLVELQPDIGQRLGQLPQGAGGTLGDCDRVPCDPRQLDQAERPENHPGGPGNRGPPGQRRQPCGGIGSARGPHSGSWCRTTWSSPMPRGRACPSPGSTPSRKGRRLAPNRGPPPASPPSPASGRRGRSRPWRFP